MGRIVRMGGQEVAESDWGEGDSVMREGGCVIIMQSRCPSQNTGNSKIAAADSPKMISISMRALPHRSRNKVEKCRNARASESDGEQVDLPSVDLVHVVNTQSRGRAANAKVSMAAPVGDEEIASRYEGGNCLPLFRRGNKGTKNASTTQVRYPTGTKGIAQVQNRPHDNSTSRAPSIKVPRHDGMGGCTRETLMNSKVSTEVVLTFTPNLIPERCESSEPKPGIGNESRKTVSRPNTETPKSSRIDQNKNLSDAVTPLQK
ncbi:hypothetical protein B0T10DRAFT_456179 [Thelonectria olida]|uniref:Uncharacterized protein n=1 Tax=Thelonectria olida TaxID=1576542 RepID=A0A9P8WF24_9HYPO|nr:hypothetical protein B0T10DRAFT_456179 [Thelonectria olida]